MRAPRKCELEERLQAYFASLRSAPLKQTLKRSVANWRLYAAVTSSAMAMATGAAAAVITGSAEETSGEPGASFRTVKPNLASTRRMPLIDAARQQIDAASQAPVIVPGGIVPLDGTMNTIQPGEFVTIYGVNLASGIFNWSGNFPLTLGGTSVQINGKPAYLVYVSPGQINLQAPDDTATGTVPVVVTTAAGSTTSMVTLSPFAPSFALLDRAGGSTRFVAGIILRPRGGGAYNNGAYDILGPTGKVLGY